MLCDLEDLILLKKLPTDDHKNIQNSEVVEESLHKQFEDVIGEKKENKGTEESKQKDNEDILFLKGKLQEMRQEKEKGKEGSI